MHPRALAAWAGTDRVSALPARVVGLTSETPAAATLALFVGGAVLAVERVKLPIEELVEANLVERIGTRIRARVAIVPLGPSLLVCDRFDAQDTVELVAAPDDSSHHLASAIPPGRRARWIDFGCGSAFAQLARPELATAMLGVDRNPRAVAFARLGAELSAGGHRHLAVVEGDVGPCEPAELVTCNAPIPGALSRAMWRRAGDDFFARLWPAIRASLTPGGLAVVHAARRAIPDELPGERAIVAYADFAVLWWRPDEPARLATATRALTPDRPHLDARDRDDALAQRA